MSLIALVALSSQSALAAGTAIWLEGEPDPTVTPGLTPVAVSEALPSMRWGSDDDAARAALSTAVEASVPLLEVFDGELQILRDLETALDAVEVIRPEDRELVWRAELLHGLAAWRYFGETLTTDPAAAPFATVVGGQPAVAPWRDALALDPERLPTESELPGEDARLAYQELRARLLLEKPAEIRRGAVTPGVRFVVDGRLVELESARVGPGIHRAFLETDGLVRTRLAVELEAGELVSIDLPATPDQLAGLAQPLRDSEGGMPLSAPTQAALAMVQGPVQLVVPTRRSSRRFEIRDGAAVELASVADTSESPAGDELALRVGLGGAWVYDGDYLLQNAQAGAPSSTETVNALAPMLHLTGELHLGPAVVGAGVDAMVPLGTWHELPSGDGNQRLRAYGHVQAGLPFLRLTAGLWTPWHVGLGGRVVLPLSGPFGVDAGYVHGLGLTLARDQGEPSFEAAAARMGWLGAHWTFGS